MGGFGFDTDMVWKFDVMPLFFILMKISQRYEVLAWSRWRARGDSNPRSPD
jgi:hypothetical protein